MTKKTTTTSKKQTTAAASTTVKAAASKELKTSLFIQHLGKEVSEEDLVKRVTDIWNNELGKESEPLTELSLYVKPEENAVYYVANGVSGKIDL